MAKVKNALKIYLDPVANTFNIWWDDPKKAYSSEEVDSPLSNDVLIKDRFGRPISLEIIGIFPKELNIVQYLKSHIRLKSKEPFLLETT
jgi:hypothetical protein